MMMEKRKKEEDAKVNFQKRFVKTYEGNHVLVSEEVVMPFKNTVGDLIGEVAMVSKAQGKGGSRALTVMAHTTCVFLALNDEIFKLLIEEKLRKETEVKVQFVLEVVPKLGELFSFH